MKFVKKKLNILLIPNNLLPYDLNQLEELKNAFTKLDVNSQVLKEKYSEKKLKILLKDYNFNIIFAVNKGRPKELKKDVKFISWFQDFYYDSDKLLDHHLESDIIYFYASKESFGVEKKINCYSTNLYPGINPTKFLNNFINLNDSNEILDKFQVLDFSYCGYIPTSNLIPFYNLHYRNYDYSDKHFSDEVIDYEFSKLTHKNENKYSLSFYKNFIVDLQCIVETNYIPLSGNLDVKKIAKILKKRILKNFKFINTQIFKEFIPFFSTDYPRFLDRIETARLLSKYSYNFGLFGKGWKDIAEFNSFAGDHIYSEERLFDIYRKSKINIYNNTHGLGMHSKVFEIMANGGFLALPQSQKNFLASGINECFNENEHFVTFKPESFDDMIEDWLYQAKKRIKVGFNARKLVLSNHTWEKRAKKILKDIEI